jgi:hypothetical protein
MFLRAMVLHLLDLAKDTTACAIPSSVGSCRCKMGNRLSSGGRILQLVDVGLLSQVVRHILYGHYEPLSVFFLNIAMSAFEVSSSFVGNAREATDFTY